MQLRMLLKYLFLHFRPTPNQRKMRIIYSKDFAEAAPFIIFAL